MCCFVYASVTRFFAKKPVAAHVVLRFKAYNVFEPRLLQDFYGSQARWSCSDYADVPFVHHPIFAINVA